MILAETPAEPDVVAPDGGLEPAGSRMRQVRAHLADPLYRTSYLLILSTGVTALLGFAFWTIAAHLYTPREVGINSSAIAAMSFVSGLAQLGLGGLLTRFIPSAGWRLRGLILDSYAAIIAASLVCGAAAALTSPLWSPSLGFIAHSTLWALGFVFATVAWSIFNIQDQVMTGLGSAHVVPLENATYAAAKLILLVVLSGVSPLAGPFIGWNAPGVAGVALITWLILGRLLPRYIPILGPSRLPAGRKMVNTVGASFAGSILLTVAVTLTPVIVTDISGPRQEAYFYAPWTLLVTLNAVTANTMVSLTVEAAHNPGEVFVLARRALINTFALLTPVLFLIIAGASLILHVYGPDYAHAGTTLMRLLALSLFPSAVTSIGLGVARILGHSFAVIMIQAVPSLIQVGLTVWLLKTIGIAGAGWAQLAADGSGAIVLLLTILRPMLRRHPESTV